METKAMSKASEKITEKRIEPGYYQVFKGGVLIGYMVGSCADYSCLGTNRELLARRYGLQGARAYWKNPETDFDYWNRTQAKMREGEQNQQEGARP